MRLQQWAANGWLRPHQTTRQQISDLLAIVDRDLAWKRKCQRRWRPILPQWKQSGHGRRQIALILTDFTERIVRKSTHHLNE
jgi:hypothetical protein